MKCEEVREHLAAFALGDLDVEPKREVEAHLAGCTGCRAESDRISRTVADLRSLPDVETAEGRRDRAVAAMSKEHADRVQGFLLRPRRRGLWLTAGAAAAFLAVLVGGYFLFKPTATAYTLRIVEVRGRAQCLKSGAWSPLQPGMVLQHGDRIITENETVVRAEIWWGAGGDTRVGTLFVNQSACLTVGRSRTLDLERGEIYGEIADREPARIRTIGNDTLAVRSGRFSAGMRETYALVLGVSNKKPQPVPGADAVFEDRPFGEVAEAVAKISGRPIRPADEKVAQCRVTFFGFKNRGAELVSDLRSVVRDQGIWLREEGSGFVANPVYAAEKREVAHRLFARVLEGEASLGSTGGVLRLVGGEEGVVEVVGTPSRLPLESSEVAWIRPGYYSSPARRPMPLPGSIAFRIIGTDDQRRPLVECTVEGAEFLTSIDGHPLAVTVGDATSTGEGEIVVPVKIRIEKKR